MSYRYRIVLYCVVSCGVVSYRIEGSACGGNRDAVSFVVKPVRVVGVFADEERRSGGSVGFKVRIVVALLLTSPPTSDEVADPVTSGTGTHRRKSVIVAW